VRASRKALAAAVAASCACLFAAGPAGAEFEPIQLVSESAREQADEALAPAISADGRYVAFQGSVDGVRGVFRKDLASGALELVAGGDAYASPPAAAGDAAAPSISADGRYVSFTTTAPLDPANDRGAATSDVYVADMSSSPPSYELASALDGCDPATSPSPCGLAYASDQGALASGRVALSADGRKVVFVTRAASDLLGEAGATPAGQVVLRDLDTDATTLVSAERDPDTGTMSEEAVPGGAVTPTAGGPGASLSADGTTVAWLGAHLPAQVPLLAGEAEAISSRDRFGPPYAEPLWRRIVDGPQAPTRRIVGGGDPLAPGCPPQGTLEESACRGPFDLLPGATPCEGAPYSGWLAGISGRLVDGVPQLSADGRAVALIGQPNGFSNVFLVDMHDGLSRRQAVLPLTRETPIFDPCLVGQPQNVPGAGDVFDVAISADGRRIAFATARQQFPLAPPNLIGSPPAGLGLTELYLIDLGAETLQRVTVGPNGAPSLRAEGAPGGQGASSPSFGAGGSPIAFASLASNLVPGDTNGASDAFVVSDRRSASPPGEVSVSPSPPGPQARPLRRLVVGASSQLDGSVRLTALVPAAGTLRARADTLSGPGRPRPVARARRRAGGGRLLVLRLEPARRFRRLTHEQGGLAASLRVAFSQPGEQPLRQQLQVRFRVFRGATTGRSPDGWAR
jgi:Tol biopolymer transport system component